MTPTATKTRDVTAQLEAAERKWQEASEHAATVSRDFATRFDQARALQDRRRSLAIRTPSLVDHRGEPANPDNEVAQVDKQIIALGDLADLKAQVDHARALEQHEKVATQALIAENFDAILAGLVPEQRATRDALQAALAAARQAADDYLGSINRVQGLIAGTPARHGARVPGLDAAAELRRVLAGWGDLPIPAEMGR